MEIEKTLHSLLITHFAPTELWVDNESYKHAGHAGHVEAGGGEETHFSIVVVSAAFEGKNRVQCQREVNKVLQPLFDQGLHALAMKTYSPEQWALRNQT